MAHHEALCLIARLNSRILLCIILYTVNIVAKCPLWSILSLINKLLFCLQVDDFEYLFKFWVIYDHLCEVGIYFLQMIIEINLDCIKLFCNFSNEFNRPTRIEY
jgi:hypothetical protein